MKRELTEEEKIQYEKSIVFLKKSLEELEYNIESLNLVLEEGLDFNKRREKEELTNHINELKEKLNNKDLTGQQKIDLNYQIKSAELLLNKGIDFKYAKSRFKIKSNLDKEKSDFLDVNKRINICNDHLKNGVEVKNKKGWRKRK